MCQTGQIPKDAAFWQQGMVEWGPISEIINFSALPSKKGDVRTHNAGGGIRWPKWAVIGLGAVILLIVLIVIGSGGSKFPTERVWASRLDGQKQQIFDKVHFVGTATGVKIDGTQEKGENEVVQFTIFWDGPIQKSGHTTIAMVYNAESKTVTEAQVIETTGMTKQQAVDSFLKGWEIGTALAQ